MNIKRLLLSIACLLGALWFGSTYYFHKTGADGSKDWHCITGKMQVVTIAKSVHRTSRSGSTVTYSPHVAYSYTYNGQHYQGNVISFPDPNFNSLKEANSFQSKYSEGSPATIWFDPKAPSRSCLVQGETRKLNYEVYFALALLTGGVLNTPIFSLNKSDKYLDSIPDRTYRSGF
ncbi:hypothetical protein BH11CYA1_BH11CYA1_43620 [soil metagenome]